MLSDEQLNKMAAAAAKIERLREKATPGPWRSQHPRSDDILIACHIHGVPVPEHLKPYEENANGRED